jgi:hypothetical protein
VIFLTLGNHHKTGLIGHHRNRNKNQLGIIKAGRIKRCGDGRCWRESGNCKQRPIASASTLS